MIARRRRFTANTKAPRRSYAVPAGSPVGGKGKAKYPVNTVKRARNAIARVGQHGSAAEKKLVYAKIRKHHPALARRSSVIPTRTGTGRHHGQPKGARNTR
jgi:hypothetical protein